MAAFSTGRSGYACTGTCKIIDGSSVCCTAVVKKRRLDSTCSEPADRCRPLPVACRDTSYAQLASSYQVLWTGRPAATSSGPLTAPAARAGYIVLHCYTYSFAGTPADPGRSALPCKSGRSACDTDEIPETLVERTGQ